MRDKNGFEVEPGEDWNDKKSDETIKYMTSQRKTPHTEPRRLANGGSSNTEVIVNNGKIHIIENGLEDLVKDVVNAGFLVAQTKPSKADIFLLAVPTPLEINEDGIPKPNIEFVLKAARSITKFIEPGNLVILESTNIIVLKEVSLEELKKYQYIKNQ